MRATFYSMNLNKAYKLVNFCKMTKINIKIHPTDDGLMDVTISSLENQCTIASCFCNDTLILKSFASSDYPHFIIDTSDFERMVII